MSLVLEVRNASGNGCINQCPDFWPHDQNLALWRCILCSQDTVMEWSFGLLDRPTYLDSPVKILLAPHIARSTIPLSL